MRWMDGIFLALLGAIVCVGIRWVTRSVRLDVDDDDENVRQKRVVRLTADACKVWPTSHVIVSPNSARIFAEDGTILAQAVGDDALDQLELLVWKRLEDA